MHCPRSIEVLHGSENMTSRTGKAPSCRATAGENCTETVGRMKSGAHYPVRANRAREARTRGRVIGVSVGCLFVCLFVCLWTQKRAV